MTDQRSEALPSSLQECPAPATAGAVPTPSSPQGRAASVQSASPFGWTGIRRERYTPWRGHLDGRTKIVLRMIQEGVRFNIKTWPVILLLVLGWMFTAFFPVLSAAMGGMSLEADNPDTWTGAEPTHASMHRSVTNDSVAVYPLPNSVFDNRTQFLTNAPVNWSAYVNTTMTDGATTANLYVVPPRDAQPSTYALIEVQATTGLRTDIYSALTTIAPDRVRASLESSYSLVPAGNSFEGAAGGTVAVRFYINNTGTLPDGYNITIDPAAAGWGLSAYVDGSKVALKTRTVGSEAQGPRDIRATAVYKYFQLDLPAGASAQCVARFSTRADSARHNDVNIAIGSRSDAVITGSYHVVVRLTGTKKVDLTGSILFDQVMANQVLFALLLAAVVGSRMIATDLHEKSYNLYFARPLTKRDYIVGKFGTVSALLCFMTIIPALVTYALIVLLSNVSGTYFIDHIWAWGAILGDGIAVVLTLGTLSLAFSSLTSRRFYAAAAMVVTYLVTTIIGSIVVSAFNIGYGRLIGIPDDLEVVGRVAFNLTDSMNLGFPWYYSLGVLAVIWTVCIFLLWYRVERTELSE